MPTRSSRDRSTGSRLLDGLRARSWRYYFDHGTLQRSESYLRDEVITLLSIELPAGDSSLVIEAEVSGTAAWPYEVNLVITLVRSEITLKAYCSCPVQHRCKHAAAVLEWLSRRQLDDLAAGQTPGATNVTLSPPVQAWLLRLEAQSLAPDAPAKRSPDQFLAYCLEPEWPAEPDRDWQLVLRPAVRHRSGAVRVRNTKAQADPARPAAYMAPEDIPLAAIFGRLTRNARFGESFIRGPGWSTVLLGALELGRLYCARVDDDYADYQYDLIQPAPPTPIDLAWDMQPDGSTEPVLRFPREGLVLLPCEPPLVLDPKRLCLGPAASRYPLRFLASWAEGPPLDPEEHALVAGRLARVATPEPLPVPKETVLRRLDGHEPVPHLLIRNATIGAHPGFDTIIGELSFRYGDSPRLYPLPDRSTARESWLDGEERVILERDRAAERALEMSLDRHGLVPLHEIFRPIDLSPETSHAVTVDDPFPSVESRWLEFIDEDVPELRAAGWIIDVDPHSGLVVHDLTSFVPAIAADPDHGIDWFRFDLTADFEGHKVNLIPLIAEAIAHGLPDPDAEDLPEFFLIPSDDPAVGHLRFPSRRFLDICRQVAHLFQGKTFHPGADDQLPIDRLSAAGLALDLELDDSETIRALARLGRQLRDITSLPAHTPPAALRAELRSYQHDGYRWMRFLAEHGLHGILADDMGLGKTVQTLAFLASLEHGRARKPSLVVSPTSVVGNWAAEAARFTPGLDVLVLHGSQRAAHFDRIPQADLVLTSYPLLARDHEVLGGQEWKALVLDEAQFIKNPMTAAAQRACTLRAEHRFCLSGTPMENHLGELWSLMRFLMPGYLGDQTTFSRAFRRPIERERDANAQHALNQRVAPLILRPTKDEVATELPPKTEIVHRVPLGRKESDLYESVRAAMDKRVRDALAERGLAKSHIVVLDALLKLRQICCHPSLLKLPDARKIREGSKLQFLTASLLPQLLEEGRRILLFSQFTSMLALIEAEIEKAGHRYLKLTGNSRNRPALVKEFQGGTIPLFLISLKAGGTGLNLTAADTVIHYDPWWNPAVESQATDRAHRIGQDKPVFVHKLISEGTIEERILELQERKAALVSALLSEETSRLRIDRETLSHLFAPISPH